MPIVEALIPVLAVVAALMVGRLLWARSRALGVVLGLVAGIVVGGGLAVLKQRLLDTPERRAEELLRQIAAAAPGMNEIFKVDEQVYHDMVRNLAGLLRQMPSDPKQQDAAIGEAAMRMSHRVSEVVVRADDSLVAGLIRSEAELLDAIAAENIRLCAERVKTMRLDPRQLSEAGRAVFSRAAEATAAAYKDGKGKPLPPRIDQQQAEELQARMLAGPKSAFSPAEAQALQTLAAQTDATVCRLGRKLQSNLAALPPADSARLIRFMVAAGGS